MFRLGDEVRVPRAKDRNGYTVGVLHQGAVEEIEVEGKRARLKDGWFKFSELELVPLLDPTHVDRKGEGNALSKLGLNW